jgi:hypothetical protein
MKKTISTVLASALVASLAFTMVGCNITESQIKTIAQTSGTAAAVAWIAKENPNRETMDLVSAAMDIVFDNLTAISTQATYTEVLYPALTEFVRSDAVEDQYEPLVLAAGLATLQAVDVFFVMYPDWKAKEGLAMDIAKSFIMGAKTGFSLADNDPMLIEARSVGQARARVFKP